MINTNNNITPPTPLLRTANTHEMQTLGQSAQIVKDVELTYYKICKSLESDPKNPSKIKEMADFLLSIEEWDMKAHEVQLVAPIFSNMHQKLHPQTLASVFEHVLSQEIQKVCHKSENLFRNDFFLLTIFKNQITGLFDQELANICLNSVKNFNNFCFINDIIIMTQNNQSFRLLTQKFMQVVASSGKLPIGQDEKSFATNFLFLRIFVPKAIAAAPLERQMNLAKELKNVTTLCNTSSLADTTNNVAYLLQQFGNELLK